MKIAVWRTGHEIADTVADAFVKGIARNSDVHIVKTKRYDLAPQFDVNICYGILRGATEVFRNSPKHWFNVDRGYIDPGHYDGFYRVNYKGTQAKYDPAFPTKPINIKFLPWRPVDRSRRVLICPPTDYVKGFFSDIDENRWVDAAIAECNRMGMGYKVRTKEMTMHDAMDDVAASSLVYTFNCSLGWKALRIGIPCISDVNDSLVGSYYKGITIDNFEEQLKIDRMPLFEFMAAQQFKLDEIEDGKAQKLLNYYIA